VDLLGEVSLPVEVISMAASLVSCALKELGLTTKLRQNRNGSIYVTTHLNYIVECTGMAIEKPLQLIADLGSIVGVLEHGILLDMVNLAVIGDEAGVVERPN
jgi:ribose 5-phosphate isomerase A